MVTKNKLFRDAFKARLKLDMAIVDKHYENLCKFAEVASTKIGKPISVYTPSGIVSFQPGLVDFTFSFERVGKSKKAKAKKGKKK